MTDEVQLSPTVEVNAHEEASRKVAFLLQEYEVILEAEEQAQNAYLAKEKRIMADVNDRIAELQLEIDKIKQPYKAEMDSEYHQLVLMLDALSKQKDKLVEAISDMADQCNGSVKGRGYMAVWNPPSYRFNNKLLMGFSKSVPEVLACGEPTPARFVLRRIKEGV